MIIKTIFKNVLLILIFNFFLATCSPAGVNPAPIPAGALVTPSIDTKIKTTIIEGSKYVQYSHKNGLFTLLIPEGWKIIEDESFATFTAPDESATIHIDAVNTGIPLDENAFGLFVKNTENNNFGHLFNYQLQTIQMDEKAGLARIGSQFNLGNTLQKLTAIYLRKDKAILCMRLQVWDSESAKMGSIFNQMVNSTQFDLDKAAKLTPYNLVYDFIGPLNLFKLSIPTSWQYSRRTITNGTLDIFSSPDSTLRIENLAYDDGKTIKPNQAFQITSSLTWELFAKDILFSDMQVQPDGSTRWTWHSDRNKTQGITFYELKGTTFLMLTFFCKSDYQTIFAPLFSSIIQSYQPLQ